MSRSPGYIPFWIQCCAPETRSCLLRRRWRLLRAGRTRSPTAPPQLLAQCPTRPLLHSTNDAAILHRSLQCISIPAADINKDQADRSAKKAEAALSMSCDVCNGVWFRRARTSGSACVRVSHAAFHLANRPPTLNYEGRI